MNRYLCKWPYAHESKMTTMTHQGDKIFHSTQGGQPHKNTGTGLGKGLSGKVTCCERSRTWFKFLAPMKKAGHNCAHLTPVLTETGRVWTCRSVSFATAASFSWRCCLDAAEEDPCVLSWPLVHTSTTYSKNFKLKCFFTPTQLSRQSN